MKQLGGNLITIKYWSVVVFGLSYTKDTKVALSYFISSVTWFHLPRTFLMRWPVIKLGLVIGNMKLDEYH